jgi:23S rRNA-/tRNA-specific pseudouridylate synthase
MNWHTVHKDRWLIVVDKPYGLPTQAPKGGGENLYDQLRKVHPYVGLHHRLDTPASGLVLFTLDKAANSAIAEGFRTHTIARQYQVVVVGDPGPSGTWDGPIDGKSARTHFTRIGTGGGLAVLSVQLETGRTHQIRRHATMNGHPIAGDRRHGGAAGRLWSRLALHACALELAHPVKGPALSLSAPVPVDLAELWAQAHPHRGTQAP